MGSTNKHILKILTLILISSKTIAQTDIGFIRPEITRIVNNLRKDGTVHFGYGVGYGGMPETNNFYYQNYLKLKNKATNAELALLTKDSSKCIVVYSFKILYDKQYILLKGIFLDHVNDTTFFWTAGGCTGFADRINWYMLKLLEPTQKSGSINYITKAEYDFYSDRFTKEDSSYTGKFYINSK